MVSIEAERRRRVQEVITDAAMRALFRDGPDATVDAVAELAAVGRATVFRYFPNRDELLAAGLQHAYTGFMDGIPLRQGDDVDAWLTTVLTAVVTRSVRGGAGYLRTLLDPGDGALAEVVRSREERRGELNSRLANELWRAHGRTGRAPRRLIDAVGLLTGPHAIWSLHVDLGLEESRIVERLAWMIRTLTRDE